MAGGEFTGRAELNADLQAEQFGRRVKPLTAFEEFTLAAAGRDRQGNDTAWGEFLTTWNAFDPVIGGYMNTGRNTQTYDIISGKGDDISRAMDDADYVGYAGEQQQKNYTNKAEAGKVFGSFMSMGAAANAGKAPADGTAAAADPTLADISPSAVSPEVAAQQGMTGLDNPDSFRNQIRFDENGDISMEELDRQFAIETADVEAGTTQGWVKDQYKLSPEEAQAMSKGGSSMDGFGFEDVYSVIGGGSRGITPADTMGRKGAAEAGYMEDLSGINERAEELAWMGDLPMGIGGYATSIFDINASQKAQQAKMTYALNSLDRQLHLDEFEFAG
jgi:hypothetical protein